MTESQTARPLAALPWSRTIRFSNDLTVRSYLNETFWGQA